jgi:hypothetical protein
MLVKISWFTVIYYALHCIYIFSQNQQGRHGNFDKGKTTSAATKELDELMNSLSDFKMNPPVNALQQLQQQQQSMQKPVLEHVGEPPYAKPNKPPKPQHLVKTETVATRTETHIQTGQSETPPFPQVAPVETPPLMNQSKNAQNMMNQSQNVPQMMSQNNSQMNQNNSQMMNQNINTQMMSQTDGAPQMMSQQQTTQPQKQTTQIQQHTTNLDSMLGNLQSDMNRQGVSTVAKGHCAACNKPIVGQVNNI